MFLDFEAAFDSPHQSRLLEVLCCNGVPGKFVRFLYDMIQRTTAAVRTPARCKTPFEMITGKTQKVVAGPILFNFNIEHYVMVKLNKIGPAIMRRTYVDIAVIFRKSSTINLVSKMAAAYGPRLRPDKWKQIWVSSRPRTPGIRVDGQRTELVDEFCYLGCTPKNNGSYENDVQQRCAKVISALKSLTKPLWSTPLTNEVKLRVYLSTIRSISIYGSKTWAAPSTVMERLDCTERKLLRGLLGYFWPRVCLNEDLYAETDVV
ncbi:hypothetical protein RB195_014972 [Necator americanus]|uniref:Reverse transcriptase domain-containing protein n=1 Tax=Necator americanus TaxID=51031 RepID=A0ABR1E2M1_NECAM